MNTEALRKYFENYWGILALLVWGGALLGLNLVGLDRYGIEEQAARGLLLVWSVSDNIVNPIVTLGAPDFRALLFVPIGIYWPGSMLAAKIFSILLAFFAATLLYKWCVRNEGQESALLALALFVISPMLIQQIDALGAGIFLLISFAVANWLDKAYRAKPKVFGGWYFSQMLTVGVAITLHPVALALPLALALHWKRFPCEDKKSLHIYVGLVISIVVAMSIKGGWNDVQWISNPLAGLANALQGGVLLSAEDINWLAASLVISIIGLVIIVDKQFWLKDLLGLVLVLATLFGLLIGDANWALIVSALILFRGVPLLVRFNQSLNKTGLIGQRGLVVGVAFLASTFFMLQDKAQARDHFMQVLDAEDSLISKVAQIAADETVPFQAASQWPGRTMLVARRDVLGLPPAVREQEQFVKNIKMLTHIIFDPYKEKNSGLTAMLATSQGETETLTVEQAGVIIQIRNHQVELRNHRPAVETTGDQEKSAVHEAP